jgi:hypothetical protein
VTNARHAFALAVLSPLLPLVACSKRSPPHPAASVGATASSNAPRVRSVSSARNPKLDPDASDDAGGPPSECERRHWDQPWLPRQTTAKPRQSVVCKNPDCVSVEPVLETGDGCKLRRDRCRRVTVTPRVSAADPSLGKTIQALLDGEIVEVRADDCWLTFLDYTVHHDERGILDVTFRTSGLGAYPSTQTAHVAIALSTGERLRARTAFSARTLPELTATLKRRAHAAWKTSAKKHPEVFQGRDEPVFGAEQLDNFIIHPDGITFFFDFGLPHAMELATPMSEFDFTNAEIRRFVDPKGPLRFLLEERP